MRFANPKAMQNFTNQFGAAAAMGGNPRAGAGTRPRGTPTTGGPKPAPGMMGIGNAVRNAVSGVKASQAAGNVASMVGKKFGGFGMKKGGSVSSASKRADGCAVKGKTKGKIV